MISRVLPVILIIFSIGIFFLYISPTYRDTIMPLRAQIDQANKALAAAEEFNNKQTQIAAERARIPRDGIDKLEQYLPDGVDNVQMILDLNALAQRSGVTLSNFGIKENKQAVQNASPAGVTGDTSSTLLNSPKTKGTESLDLSVTATGTYGAFRTFLYGIEHSLRPLDITQIVVTESKTGVYSFDMTLRIYWLK